MSNNSFADYLKNKYGFTEDYKYLVNGVEKTYSELSQDEKEEIHCMQENEVVGDLNKEDGIECQRCLNRGFITILENHYEKVVDCECKKVRRTYHHLKQSGISEMMLEKYKFKNYTTNESWQQFIKTTATNYVKDIVDGNNYWWYLCGITGSGKTHICTAIFQNIVSLCGYQGYYMLWNNEIPLILSLEKSTYSDRQEEYEKKMKMLETIDVLYIDDFMKLTENSYNNQSISLAYKILNTRYINNKITIISSEYTTNKISSLDSAIFGRIVERCTKKYIIDLEDDKEERNVRLQNVSN